MSYVKHLRCIKCGATSPVGPGATICPACGGIQDVVYDYEAASRTMTREALKAREYSMWRYREILPIEDGSRKPPLRVGWSPIYRADRLAEFLGVRSLFIKDDGVNPTASLKDRASAIGVAKALEAGSGVIACASTGNAGSSLAGNAASAGLKSYIFVPERAPQGKVAQLLLFGANVVSVQGDYRAAYELSAKAIERWGWYNRNAAINPYLVEGKKTVTLELAEQLDWKIPDWVALSVGDGCTIAGAWKGFDDLYQLGLIDRRPRMLGVQAEGCNPLSRAFHTGLPLEPTEENTLADSIAVGVPRNPDKALDAIRESRGTMIDVPDEEILEAMRLLGRTCGVFGEPAGVTGLAGLRRALAQGVIERGESVGVIITGNGLKDVKNGIRAAGEPVRVPPDLDELMARFPDLA